MKKEYQQLKNGEKLAYIEYGNGNNNVIFIHGNYSSSYQFLELLKYFDSNSYKIYAVDLRCFGDSTCYRKIESMDDYTEDIMRFIKAKNIKDPHLLGFSLGGGVCLQLAGSYPERFKTLTLISSITYRGYPLYKKDEEGNVLMADTYRYPNELKDDPDVKPILNAIKNNDIDKVKHFMDSHFFLKNKPDEKYYNLLIGEVMKLRGLTEAIFAIASFNMTSEHNFYTPGNHTINYINLPILHIVGVDDILTPKDMVLDNYFALMKYSKLIEYNEFGHSLLYDIPEEIAKQINAFISKSI